MSEGVELWYRWVERDSATALDFNFFFHQLESEREIGARCLVVLPRREGTGLD
jgi:hypothetical protein